MATQLQPGHHLATDEIVCRAPFATNIAKVQSFDILAVTATHVLVRHDGIRVWKPSADITGRAIRISPLVVASDGYHMISPAAALTGDLGHGHD